MTAETFLSRFRALNGDVYRSGDRVIFDGPPMLLDAVQWRLREICKSALLEALRSEERSALARVTTRRHERAARADRDAFTLAATIPPVPQRTR